MWHRLAFYHPRPSIHNASVSREHHDGSGWAQPLFSHFLSLLQYIVGDLGGWDKRRASQIE